MEYHLTMNDVKKYEILKQVAARKLKGREAAALLGYHPVHISRLKKKVMALGIKGILRPKLPSNRKLPDSLKERVKNLYRQIYYDFNIRHFNDKLQENHKINLSYETVRQILIQAHAQSRPLNPDGLIRAQLASLYSQKVVPYRNH